MLSCRRGASDRLFPGAGVLGQTIGQAIDYAVHHVKAGGHTTPKVFKGWVIDLAPGALRQLVKRHAIKVITTRRYHPGAHAVDVRINGQVLAESGFMLLA